MRSIFFCEQTVTGFGDRMRGIAAMLELASRYSAQKIFYCESVAEGEEWLRERYFPYDMVDLIRIEGVRFKRAKLPFPDEAVVLRHNSIHMHPLTKVGFPHMQRVCPRDRRISKYIKKLIGEKQVLGAHIRGTDSNHLLDDPESQNLQMLESLDRLRSEYRTNLVFLSSDCGDLRDEWMGKLSSAGYHVVLNEWAVYDKRQFRQTGAEAMLVDFFALADCCHVVRNLPSQFSRFAAWVGGRQYRGRQLC